MSLLRSEAPQETVEVTGEMPLVNTDNANIATEISGKQIVELPLNDRNPFFLTFLDSSVRNIDEGYMGGGLDNNDQAVGFLSFGGQFQGWTAYLGRWWLGYGVASGLVAFVPSVDDVQEFKVQSNSFTAQYGLSAGNVINSSPRAAPASSMATLLNSSAMTRWTLTTISMPTTDCRRRTYV